jgi:hypothetical protein
MVEFRRISAEEIPAGRRWQMNAAWDIEYNRIREYLQDRANHNVGARISQAPADRASGAKQDGSVLPADVNAIYGALHWAIDAKSRGQAERGELQRMAPSPVTIRLLAAGTIVTVLLEISIFLVMWILGQGGNLITVGVGALLAGFGYLAGEGLGRLLIGREEETHSGTVLSWIFLTAGFIGIVGMTVIRYLAARAAAEEGENVGGLVAIVLLTALLAGAVAIFHAAHMERAERYRTLLQKMFGAQLVFATEQAQTNHRNGLWQQLYDNAVDAFIAGRPPDGPAPAPKPAPAAPAAPIPIMQEPKTEQ